MAEYEISLQALSELPQTTKQQDASLVAIQLIVSRIDEEAKALSNKISEAKGLVVKGRELMDTASKLRMNAADLGQSLSMKSLEVQQLQASLEGALYTGVI